MEFQALAIEAAGALKQRAIALQLLGMLNVQTPPQIRSAALHALGEIGDRDTSFPIAQWLGNEPSPAVRMDAIDALGRTSTFEDAADTLNKYMKPDTEPDAAVRERAWREFESLLPYATNLEVLSRWASDFQNDLSRRLTVLLSLNDKLSQALRWSDLAMSRQNTGETYMTLGDPAKAAGYFESALDYWQKQKVANSVTVQLLTQLLDGLLAARDYEKAAAVGAKQIARDPAQQTIVGPRLKNAANTLHDDGIRDSDPKKLNDGIRLTDAILNMQPPIAERWQPEIRQWKADMQQKLKTIKP
jgi:tetratricopeptide (TPR) repeat protein